MEPPTNDQRRLMERQLEAESDAFRATLGLTDVEYRMCQASAVLAIRPMLDLIDTLSMAVLAADTPADERATKRARIARCVAFIVRSGVEVSMGHF